MAFAIITGVIGAINGALSIAKAFSTQSHSGIQQTGKGTGFWKYYSNSYVGTKCIDMRRVPDYIDRMVYRITKEATPGLAKKRKEIIADLKEIKEFESYAWGDCDNMVSCVDYAKAQNTLFYYIYTFSPFIHATRGEGCRIQTIQIQANMKLAKDWMIVSKAKVGFFKSESHDEIQYLDERGLEMKDIIEAISIAMAPAVLGLVQLPERFMTVLETMLKDQQEHPERGVIKGPTPEQQQQAFQNFKEMQDRQDKYTENAKDGFKALGDALSLGQKGNETDPPVNNDGPQDSE